MLILIDNCFLIICVAADNKNCDVNLMAIPFMCSYFLCFHISGSISDYLRVCLAELFLDLKN